MLSARWLIFCNSLKSQKIKNWKKRQEKCAPRPNQIGIKWQEANMKKASLLIDQFSTVVFEKLSRHIECKDIDVLFNKTEGYRPTSTVYDTE